MTEEPTKPSSELSPQHWCALLHASGLASYVLPGIGGLILPFIIWLIKKDASPEIDYHGKEAINFQISYFVYAVLCAVLYILLVGFFLIYMLGIAHVIFCIVAAVKAKEGVRYRYPFIFRLLK